MSAGLRVLDVCSGYSASTLAWAGLGFRHIGYAEIDPFPRAVLQERHGAVPVDWDHRWQEGSNITPLFGDFTKIEAHHVGPVDLLTGGTPCQSFSVAGKRLGLDDPRGNLTLEFLALARRLRVPWLVWENVPGFLSHDEGRTMGTFLRFLGECGYGFAWRVLDVQYVRVDGAERALPQRRRRLFVVGHLGDAAGPAAVLFERESLRGDTAPRREAGEGIAPTLSARTKGGGGLGTDFDLDGGCIAEAFGGNNTSGPIDVSTALSSHGGPHGRMDFESETFVAEQAPPLTSNPFGDHEARENLLVAHSLRADGFDASEDGTGRGTPIVPVTVPFDTTQITSAANYSAPKEGDPCHPLSASAHPPAVAYRITPNDGAYASGESAPSLTTGTDRSAVALVQNWAVRRLTPTECERLMGVPDEFTAITYRGKPAADGPRYKALGNSQGTNVMRWIGRGLAEVMAAIESQRAAA